MERLKEYAAPLGLAVLLVVTAGLFYVNNQGGRSESTKKSDDSSKSTDAKEDSTNKNKKTEDSKQSEQSSDKTSSNSKTDTPKDTVTFVAKSGDSYTGFARQAISGVDNSLTNAQKVAAETFLTQEAGSPYLLIGQQVTIKQEAVKEVVKKATSLSKAELAAWEQYAATIDFGA